MTYEYKVISIVKFNLDKYNEILNEYGKDGWKLVCVESSYHYLMREVKEGNF